MVVTPTIIAIIITATKIIPDQNPALKIPSIALQLPNSKQIKDRSKARDSFFMQG
jgi:hypothetical protein